MSSQTRKEAIDEAVSRLLEEENTIDKVDPCCYSKAAFLAFEEILLLLEKGVKFVRICKSFELSGILPENSSAHSFRQAFHRECKRRTGNASLRNNAEYKAGKVENTPLEPIVKAESNLDLPSPDINKEAAQKTKEEIRKMTGTVVETGLGKIIKHSDGSFEY